MKIQSINLSFAPINYAKQTNSTFIQPLQADTVSFGNASNSLKRGIRLWIDGKLNNDEALDVLKQISDEKAYDEFYSQMIAKKEQVRKSKTKEMLRYIGKESFDECSGEEILEATGIKIKKSKDGYIISHYDQPDMFCSFEDLGINEKEKFGKIFKNLVKIKKDANFEDSPIEELPKLKEIGGNANFSFSQIKDLSSLEKVGGDGEFNNIEVTEMPNLSDIGGRAYFYDTKIKSFPKLRKVGGKADFSQSKTEKLPALEKVGSILNISFSDVTELPKLKKVGDYVYANHYQLKDAQELRIRGIIIKKVPSYIEKTFENLKRLKTKIESESTD